MSMVQSYSIILRRHYLQVDCKSSFTSGTGLKNNEHVTDTATTELCWREVQRFSIDQHMQRHLESLLSLIKNILYQNHGELKATDGPNCLKSILQRDRPSAIKDISSVGGLTRFCEIFSSQLEFISDGCGSGLIRLLNREKLSPGAVSFVPITYLQPGTPHAESADMSPQFYSPLASPYSVSGGLGHHWLEPDFQDCSAGLSQDEFASSSLAGPRHLFGTPDISLANETTQWAPSIQELIKDPVQNAIYQQSNTCSSNKNAISSGLKLGGVTWGQEGEFTVAVASAGLESDSLLSESKVIPSVVLCKHYGQADLLTSSTDHFRMNELSLNEPTSSPKGSKLYCASLPGTDDHYYIPASQGIQQSSFDENIDYLGVFSEKSRSASMTESLGQKKVDCDVENVKEFKMKMYHDFQNKGKIIQSTDQQRNCLPSYNPFSGGLFGDCDVLSTISQKIGNIDPVLNNGGQTVVNSANSSQPIKSGIPALEAAEFLHNCSLADFDPIGTRRQYLVETETSDQVMKSDSVSEESHSPDLDAFRERVGRSLLDHLISILEEENGDMLASLAPDKLYTSVPQAKEEIASVGGLRKFCLLFPDEVEFVADTGGRCRIRLLRWKPQNEIITIHKGSQSLNSPSSSIEGEKDTIDGSLKGKFDGQRNQEDVCRGSNSVAGNAEVKRTAAVERLIGILRSEGGEMGVAQATAKLYKVLPRAKEEITSAGGLRKFCDMYPIDLEFIADQDGRCRIRARRATKSSRGGAGRGASQQVHQQRKQASEISITSLGSQLDALLLNENYARASGTDAANGMPLGDGSSEVVKPTLQLGREATQTLQRLIGILRSEGGEMYAARAPEVLYRAYPKAREVLIACSGFQRFCSLFPAELEFISQKGGGRDKVRLVKQRYSDAKKMRSVLQTSSANATAVANAHNDAIAGARSLGDGHLSSVAGGLKSSSILEALVTMLRVEPSGVITTAQASRRLCLVTAGAERELIAAGGFKKFCGMFPSILGLGIDAAGRDCVYLQAPDGNAVVTGRFKNDAGQTAPALLPMPGLQSSSNGQNRQSGPLVFRMGPPWLSATQTYQQCQMDRFEALESVASNTWGSLSGVTSGAWPTNIPGNLNTSADRGNIIPGGFLANSGMTNIAGLSAPQTCVGCGDCLIDSRIVPCGHILCRQCSHIIVVMLASSRKATFQGPGGAACPLCRREVAFVEPLFVTANALRCWSVPQHQATEEAA